MKKLLFVAILSGLFSCLLSAQSAVYFCKTNGSYGFCYGTGTVMAARECAYNSCIDNGGVQPEYITSTEKLGYGAICAGKDASGGIVIGVAMGYDTQEEADKEARRQCKDYGAETYKIENRWSDL